MKLSLSKLNFLNIIFIGIMFSVVIGFFTTHIVNKSYEKRVADLEDRYISQNKLLVKNEVNRVTKRAQTLETVFYSSIRNTLEEKVDFIYNVLEKNSKNLDDKELIEKYKKELDLFTWDNNSGYLYIFNSKGTMIYHGSNRKLENKNIFELSKNNPDLRSFLSDTMKKDKNFGSYKWFKPDEKVNDLYKKYVYAKKLKKYNIYIAAGIYKKELKKKIQNAFFNEIEVDRFGENRYGYFWIHSLDHKMIVHPIRKELVGQEVSKFKTLDGQYFFQNANRLVLENKEGYIDYKWYRPDNGMTDEKISYVQLLENWNMVIGSGFYLTELKDMLNAEKLILKNTLSSNLKNMFITISILFILTVLFAWALSKRIQKVERDQKDHLNMLEQYQLILDKSAVVSKTDVNGVVTYVNDNFVKVSGYKKDEVIGRPHNVVRHPETPKSQFKKLWENISNGLSWKGILKNKKKDGNSYFNSTTIVPIKDSNGKILEYISSGSDVTELFENKSKLRAMFKTDALTGLGNRVSLIDKIAKHTDGVLALVNIDRFKQINDAYGHGIGDMVIKEFSSRLFNFLKEDEDYILYRVQADVFAIFVKKADPMDVQKKLEKFIEIYEKKPYKIKSNTFTLTYTSGIAAKSENLLTYADIALNVAKTKNKKIKVYDTSMTNIEEYKQNLLWVDRLNVALSEDRIIPYYQPIYNYDTGKIEKYECLMRLVEGDEVVPPFEYLDIAKKTKLYPELTYKVVGKAIGKFANNDLEFSVNLSIEDLMNEQLMEFIYDYANQKNVFDRMVLEIVESEEIEDSDFVANTIKRFKEKGTKIAIDDFGSGYSNYEYLLTLQADYVKIDGSITKHILDDERTAEVVRSIVNFAKKSDMKTIAEFVSSEELDTKLRELDVDFAQGWYYGKAEKELLS